MVPASLDVEADQVEAKLLPVLLEQVVRQLGGEGGVQLLRLLGGQTSDEGLHGVVVIKIIRGELGLGQGDGFDSATKYIVALYCSRYQTVAKPRNRLQFRF